MYFFHFITFRHLIKSLTFKNLINLIYFDFHTKSFLLSWIFEGNVG